MWSACISINTQRSSETSSSLVLIHHSMFGASQRVRNFGQLTHGHRSSKTTIGRIKDKGMGKPVQLFYSPSSPSVQACSREHSSSFLTVPRLSNYCHSLVMGSSAHSAELPSSGTTCSEDLKDGHRAQETHPCSISLHSHFFYW